MSNPAVEEYVLAPVPRPISRRPTGQDAVFTKVVTIIGASVLVITGGIGIFLAGQMFPTLRHYGLDFFTTREWNFATDKVGVLPLLTGTLEIAVVAIVIALPLALATALFISEYAPPRIAIFLIAIVDLMAAVPSIVYGLWGRDLVMPHAADFAMFVHRTFGPLALHGVARSIVLWLAVLGLLVGIVLRFVLKVEAWWRAIPMWIAAAAAIALVPVLFVVNADPNAADNVAEIKHYRNSAFIAGIAVSMMVLPMACAIMRQVFSQTPPGEKEAALALGSTRWGMIRAVVLPFGKGGIIGGTMLALGRALGETIAVLLIIAQLASVRPNILESGTSSVSSTIALLFGEALDSQLPALLSAGFVLFLVTLLVNTIAAIIVNNSRSGAETS